MTKTNKLPLKSSQMLNTFKAKNKREKSDTDTSSTIMTTLTSTHIFSK